MNKYCGIGNLVRDPELMTTPTGKSVCRFKIAINGVKSKENENPTVDFIPCVCWDKTAENANKYLKKGSKVAVTGKLKSGKYEKDGKTQYTLEVELDKYNGLQFLSSGNKGEAMAEQQQMQETQEDTYSGFTKVETDELPF